MDDGFEFVVGFDGFFQLVRDGEQLGIGGQHLDFFFEFACRVEVFAPRFAAAVQHVFYNLDLLVVDEDEAGDDEYVPVCLLIFDAVFFVGFYEDDEDVGFQFVVATQPDFPLRTFPAHTQGGGFDVDFRAVEDEVVARHIALDGEVGVDGLGEYVLEDFFAHAADLARLAVDDGRFRDAQHAAVPGNHRGLDDVYSCGVGGGADMGFFVCRQEGFDLRVGCAEIADHSGFPFDAV